jgi:hypothetical protein
MSQGQEEGESNRKNTSHGKQNSQVVVLIVDRPLISVTQFVWLSKRPLAHMKFAQDRQPLKGHPAFLFLA